MLNQLAQFSLVLLLVMLGFAASFNALYGINTVLVENLIDSAGTPSSALVCDVNSHPIVGAFGTVGSSLLTMFGYMLGEFSFDMFYDRYESEDGEDCGGVDFKEASCCCCKAGPAPCGHCAISAMFLVCGRTKTG